jgi:hypothetical protein
MAKPRKKPVAIIATPAVPRPPPPPAKPLPEWFSHGVSSKDSRKRTNTHGQYAYQLVDACLAGKFSLPMFQREVVWTCEQQVTLLDSLVRGWTCGSLLIWKAPRDTPCRPLDGCPAYSGTEDLYLVLDGQQRLSALVAAVQGHLGVRWDGERWGPTGYLDSMLCFQGWRVRDEDSLWEFQRSLHDYAGDETWTAAIAAWESLYRAEIQVSVLEEYTEQEALVAYRRFNTTGTAHTAADLCAGQGAPQAQ